MSARATMLVFREGLGGSMWQAQSLNASRPARRGPLADIIEPGELVILLLPGDDAPVREVQLPNVRAAERNEAARAVLEPQLAESVDALVLGCFAPSTGKLPLAVWVNEARLAAWLGAVANAGGSVVAAVPEWLLLYQQHTQGTAELWCRGDKAWLLAGSDVALCVETGLLAVLVEQLFAKPGGDAGDTPPLLTHGLSADVSEALAAVLPGCERGESPPDWVDLWRRFGDAERMDLRRLAGLRDGSRKSLPWRTALAALIVVALTAGGYVYAQFDRLAAERDRWDASSAAAFRAAFPDEARVVDVKRQLRLKLRLSDGETSLRPATLLLMNALSQVMADSAQVQIKSLVYESGRFVASLEAPAIAELEALRARARELVPELAPRLTQLVAAQGTARGELHLQVAR